MSELTNSRPSATARPRALPSTSPVHSSSPDATSKATNLPVATGQQHVAGQDQRLVAVAGHTPHLARRHLGFGGLDLLVHGIQLRLKLLELCFRASLGAFQQLPSRSRLRSSSPLRRRLAAP